MNKKIFISLIIVVIIIAIILSLLISLRIDYYEKVPFDIKNNNVFVILKEEPQSVFININNQVYEIKQWNVVTNETYVLDFTINHDIKDKVFCYIATYRLNYLSYIFKIVFNI